MLQLAFLKGPLAPNQAKELLLTGERPLIFGARGNGINEVQKFILSGDRIVEEHFEILFSDNTLILRSLNNISEESCGVYMRLFPEETFSLKPGNAFRIGTLEFCVERFNTGIVSDIGQRPHMEDTFCVV